MSKNKKRPKLSSIPQNRIQVTDITSQSKKILFSYEFLDLTNKKYSFEPFESKIVTQFYNEYLKKLQEYSQKDNFKKSLSDGTWRKKNHIHPIDWSDSQIRESSFKLSDSNLMEQIKGDCWQLGINNQGFRIHGFFIENVFYIVWLDPMHNLYHRK